MQYSTGAAWFWRSLIVATLAACGGGGDDDPVPPTVTAPPATAVLGTTQTIVDTGIVSGTVTDAAGAALGAVTVAIDGVTGTANEQGFFVLEKVAPGASRSLSYGKSGYIAARTQVTVRAGQQTHLELSLRKVAVTRTGIVASSTGVVTDTRTDGRNGGVTIPPNSVVDATGRAVASYTVELTTMLPSDPGYTQVFPGRFLGGSQPGSTANPVPLQSFGVINVDLKDAQGAPLKLAPGAKATLSFPIDADRRLDPGTPTVPLWSLDAASGVWIQEGQATRSGAGYTAQVGHFSPWNLDRGFGGNAAFKEVHVRGLNNVPVANARVIVEGTGYRQVGNTGDDGVITITVLAGDTIRVFAQKGLRRSTVTTEVAPGNGLTWVNNIDLVEPQATVMLSWGAAPADLDAHLTGPGSAHVWWAARGSATTAPFAKLDTDDQNGLGPEIITSSVLQAGTYRYSVHNFSAYRGVTAPGLQGSTAVVNLVIPRTNLIRRYDVPVVNPGGGNLWVVFEMDVDGNGTPTVRDVSAIRNVVGRGDDVQ